MPLLDALAKTSVPMNGIQVPFSRCVQNLQRYCRPVMFHNETTVYEASHVGSSFLFRYDSLNFVLFSAHQLGSGANARQPSEAFIILENEDGTMAGRSPDASTRVKYDQPSAKTLNDIVILTYSSQSQGLLLSPLFYQLSQFASFDLNAVAEGRLLAVFAIGYPSRLSQFDTEFNEEWDPIKLNVNLGWSVVYLQRTARIDLDLPHRLPLETHDRYKGSIGNPDGFSGAPVFFVYQEESLQCSLGYAGMITHAHPSGRFNVYEAVHIRTMLDAYSGPSSPIIGRR